MRTFTAILRFELRAALRERTLPLLFALFACALAYAMGNGLRWAAARTEAFDHVRRDLAQQHGQALTRFRDAETRASSRAVSPAALAAGIWYRPTLPLAPLSFVAVGQADRFPFETRFHPTNVRAVFAPRPVSIDHPAESAAGRFDVAFVLVTVLPVLLLVACFDAWVRDRESGVARLLLAQPVSVAQLVFAKILARGGTLLAASIIWRRWFWLLTAFTLAHGLTYGLASFGFFGRELGRRTPGRLRTQRGGVRIGGRRGRGRARRGRRGRWRARGLS